jgi:hypothetical protein
MTTATISDVTEYELTAGGKLEVLRQQLPDHPAEVLLGVADNGDAVMASLTLAEAATLSERLAKLVGA